MADHETSFHAEMTSLRRARILDAAAQVFASRGFHRTTIRDIAQAAGVADGTIYTHFTNKNALLRALVEELHTIETQAVNRALHHSDDLHAFLHHYFANYLTVFANQSQPLLRVVLSEVLVNAELREHYVQHIVTPTIMPLMERLLPIAAQHGLNDERALQMLQLMSSMVLGVLMARMFNEDAATQTWEQLPDVLATLFISGMLNGEASS